MNKLFTFIVVLSAIIIGCNENTAPDKNGTTENKEHHHDKGEHGGDIIDSGSALHIEFVQDKEHGKVSLFILGGDGKTPQEITKAPVLNLKTAEGAKQITTKMVKDNKAHYEVVDDILKDNLHGRIAVEYSGKKYNLDIHVDHDDDDDDHGHDHDDDDHGHDH